jgi:hypothetical protein
VTLGSSATFFTEQALIFPKVAEDLPHSSHHTINHLLPFEDDVQKVRKEYIDNYIEMLSSIAIIETILFANEADFTTLNWAKYLQDGTECTNIVWCCDSDFTFFSVPSKMDFAICQKFYKDKEDRTIAHKSWILADMKVLSSTLDVRWPSRYQRASHRQP